MQAGQVVAFDCGDPRGQALVMAAGHHLGEGGDVVGGSVRLRAACLDLCQLGCLVLGEQVIDRGVAFPAADRQAALGTVRARSLGGRVGRDAAVRPAGLPSAGFRGGIR
ncbi:MAG: hypothetical protein ABSF03_17535 [Streptosporangiaceae bacterium]|jgi:(2Fe-2S) ferredoxin